MALMDALRFSFVNRTLELSRVTVPTVSTPSDVLIKVTYAGICGTDLHVLAGKYPCRQTADLTLGHEIAGVIVEVGKDVIRFEEGDKVAVDPNRGCKRCGFCNAGTPHFCKVGCSANTVGMYRDGGWAQYLVCHEEQVYKIGAKTNLEQAVLAEPISCVIHGLDVVSPIPVGSKILLLGAGITGSLWACALHLQGHRNVVISEPYESRRFLIRKLNTRYPAITPEELTKRHREDPDRHLFDVVIDCCGDPAAMEQGISLLNTGGKFCMFSVASKTSKIEINPLDFFWKEAKLLASKYNPYTFGKALDVIEAMGHRYLNYNILGIKTFALSEYREAIETLKKGTIIKAVFKIN